MSATPTPEHVADLAAAVRASGATLKSRAALDILEALGAAGARFLDPGDPIRAEALHALPESSGLSPAMCEQVLDAMAADWTAEQLEGLVVTELGSTEALDEFVEHAGESSMAIGPSLCVQMVAGGVPGVGVTALLRSLLVKAPTLLKPGRGDVLLPTLFARALAAVDPPLADSLAVVYWPGGSTEHEDAAIARADAVTVYGSDETVGTLRARVPVTTRLVAYHHRVSVGIVGREALASTARLEAVAGRVASAVAAYDQRGCVSPQLVLVEEGGKMSPADFAEALARALTELEAHLPTGALDMAQASRLQQARATAELLATRGGGLVRHVHGAAWTVVLENEPQPPVPAAGRFVRVRPLRDVAGAAAALAPLGPHLQTVGVDGLGARLEGVAKMLGEIGASRVVPFGTVAYPPPWWHHDGRGPLLDLIRWVDLER